MRHIEQPIYTVKDLQNWLEENNRNGELNDQTVWLYREGDQRSHPVRTVITLPEMQLDDRGTKEPALWITSAPLQELKVAGTTKFNDPKERVKQ